LTRLLDLLRQELGLTGTKEGCGEGECGACCVFLDSELVNSCLIPAAQINGSDIVTIEGISVQEQGRKVQQAFLACGGTQCGICTPGMIMAAVDLLRQMVRPSEEQIRTAISGNLCRCTGYLKIIEAVLRTTPAQVSL
jgi:carbon-monoxide dehydrogenase small subunit